MAKNTGKPTEQEFEDAFATFGKRAYLHRFTDASDIKGLTGIVSNAPAQPGDYLVVFDGHMFIAEVKSTHNTTSFPFSILKSSQTAAARRTGSAGGNYFIFVKAMVHGAWYRIPYQKVEDARAQGRASIKWAELGGFKWQI